LTILTTVTLASTNNMLPEDRVTDCTKNIGAVLMLILVLLLRQFNCTSVDE
jgi:hypothetical protein